MSARAVIYRLITGMSLQNLKKLTDVQHKPYTTYKNERIDWYDFLRKEKKLVRSLRHIIVNSKQFTYGR